MVKMFTIKTHLLLLVLALSVPFVAVVGYGIHTDILQSVAHVKAALRTLAHMMAANTGASISSPRRTLELLAERPLVKRVDKNQCDGILTELFALSPGYSNIVYTDRDGRVICSALPQPDGDPVNVGNTQWFQKLLQEKRFNVGLPYFASPGGKWVLPLGVPIWSEAREIVGMVYLPFDLSGYDPKIPVQDLPPGSHYGFFDADGVLIWRNVNLEGAAETKLDAAMARQIAAMRSGEFERLCEDGVPCFFSVVSIPETGGFAFVSIPASALFADAKRRAITSTSLALLAIAILILLASVLARRIAQPIISLEKTVHALHGGDAGARVVPSGPSDIVEVANAFNSMIDTQQSSEQLFAALLEQSPDAISIGTCEPDNHIVDVNPAYCLLSGYTWEELLGHRVADLNLWGNPEQGLATKAALAQGIPINDLLSLLRRKDGRLVPTSFSGRRIVIGGVHRIMVTRRDISERMLNELRLKESEERWHFAVEGHGDALWDWDVKARTVYRSSRFLELLGMPDASPVCSVEASTARIHPAEIQRIKEINQRLVSGVAEQEVGECRLQRLDGESVWVSYRCRVMRRDAEGTAERVIGTIRDISRRMQRQREMDAQMGKLTHQARLLALGEMASATAHEINQPLTAIASYASACARQLDDRPAVRDIVRRIEEQALRAGQIVWRMRDFAKRRGTQRQPVALVMLVADVFEWLSWNRRMHEVEFVSRISADLPAVSVDRLQIEQVLLNLIHNGIQAMEEVPGKRIIELGATVFAARSEIVISVADQGCGLPSQVALDIFTPFVTSKPDGLGLGLSISRSIVSQHGGRLWSAPREGGGSVFSFSLPLSGEPVQESGRSPT